MSGTAAFAFRAARPDGRIEAGVLDAADRDAAAAALSRLGWFPLEISRSFAGTSGGRRASAADLAQGLRALASLLGAGLPLSRALAVLDGLVPPSWTPVLPGLRARVEQGERLSSSLAATRLRLPSHVIGVIAAGEAGSGLALATEAAAHLLEQRASARSELRNALAYPLLLLVAGGASVGLLVGVVLPRFVVLLSDGGLAVPWTTRLVLGVGNGARVAALPAAAVLLALLAAHRAWVTRPKGRLQRDELLLGLPLVGRFRLLTASAAAASALSALLRSGVPLSRSLPAAAQATGDEASIRRLLQVRDRIVLGEAFSAALEAEGALSPVAIRLTRVGEETGDLAAMLGQASRIDREQATAALQRFTRYLEPTLVLLFGSLVILVAAALLQSLYGFQGVH